MTRPDDYDHFADLQEYLADLDYDLHQREHDLLHTEYVEDCPFCEEAENQEEKE